MSILGIQENKKEQLLRLAKTDAEYFHIDVMDGKFVTNKTGAIEELKKVLPLTKPSDVHLMVEDIYSFVDAYQTLRPEYITIHYEIGSSVMKALDYIKKYHIKAGLSIKPNTSIREILPYLPFVDLVLVMSVEPGRGGQKFMPKVVNKINELKRLREIYDYHYVIEVDGGINKNTASYCGSADLLVVGSYVTEFREYQAQIDKVREKVK